MGRSINEKFRGIMDKGPDVLPEDINIRCTRLFCNGDVGKSMQFVSKGKSNKLGEVDDSAREALRF